MNLGLPFFDGGRHRSPASRTAGLIEPGDFVVARWVSGAAPSAWIFFDGSETVTRDRSGTKMLIPGGAFFLDEARPYADPEQARAQAQRLNALALDANESWVAIAARRVVTGLKSFTHQVDSGREVHGKHCMG